ncbi:MAG: glutathione S-transferase [Flavobacteriales bacterium]|jgi:glutathione S-transferase
MELFWSSTSPFARKVSMFLKCSGLEDQCDITATTFESDDLRQQNPLGKIPALSDDDINLFDSSLICEYLDDKAISQGKASLYNKDMPGYYTRQLTHIRANGILEAAVASVMELRRDTEKSEYWLGRWRTAIEQGLNGFELSDLGDADNIHIGTITFVAALGYLDFRLDDYNWRNINPALANWYESIAQESWASSTIPKV